LKTRKRYPIEQSPLFKLKSKKKLADLLSFNVKEIIKLSSDDDNFRMFTIEKNEKPRQVQVPKPILEKIHKRLFKLLQRIETPEYLHSGVKKRSHITNAKAHEKNSTLVKVDIKQYYPSTKRESVYQFFRGYLLCSPDVSKILTDLSCVNGHIPTGSPLSQILAFFASLPMFERVKELSLSNQITFTVYVDDLTFSGETVAGEFIWQVKKVIHSYGYKYHKEFSSPPDKTKLVTGVAIDAGGLKVQNKHHKSIYDLYVQHIEGTLRKEDKARLLGMLSSASQVSERYNSIFRHLLK